MSYSRFGSGDVYMFASSTGGIECCMCSIARKKFRVHLGTGENCLFLLMKRRKQDWFSSEKCIQYFQKKQRMIGRLESEDPTFETAQKALNHLYLHQLHGNYVPEYAIERLKEEIKNGIHPVRIPFKKKVKNEKN